MSTDNSKHISTLGMIGEAITAAVAALDRPVDSQGRTWADRLQDENFKLKEELRILRTQVACGEPVPALHNERCTLPRGHAGEHTLWVSRPRTCGALVGQYGAAFTCARLSGHAGDHLPYQGTELSLPDVIAAFENLGIDTECGACMEVAFTSATTNTHTCAAHKGLRAVPSDRGLRVTSERSEIGHLNTFEQELERDNDR